MSELSGFRVAVLATDGFEETELTEPVKALRKAGAQVTILSLKTGEIQGVRHDLDKTVKVNVQTTGGDVRLSGFRGSATVRTRSGHVTVEAYCGFDLSFTPELSRLLFQECDRHGVKLKRAIVRCGHYSLGRAPYKYYAGFLLANYFRRNL